MLALSVVAQSPNLGGSDRKPVGPPKEPPTPPALPNCPDDFRDKGCNANGSGNHPNDLGQAQGKALTACDTDHQACVAKQTAELSANKAKCEAVAGCKLTYLVDASVCTSGGCKGTGAPDIGPFSCEAEGWYDIEDYECKRPDPSSGETGSGGGSSGGSS